MRKLILLSLMMMTLMSSLLNAQMKTMTEKDKSILVDSLITSLERDYYFTENLAKISKSYKKHLNSGDYKNITNHNEFADRLTEDFQEIVKDVHYRVFFTPDSPISTNTASQPKAGGGCFMGEENDRKNNYGFKEVKILSGNVGYLKLDNFSTHHKSYETAASAMNFLSNTDALIIDLRNNIGGSGKMVEFLAYYLFDEKKMQYLLNIIDMKNIKVPLQSWTLSYVPGKRIPDVPVYVLISRSTGSAAEAFAYDMKNLERATLVGETTLGAAHPVKFNNLGQGFTAIIPTGKISNPFLGKDWEEIGVSPHIKAKNTEAYDKAYKMILDSLYLSVQDEESKLKMKWALDGIELKSTLYVVPDKDLVDYSGSYGQRIISLKNNKLFYKRFGPESEMIPIRKDLFAVQGMDNFRVIFERNSDNKIIGLIGWYEEGRQDKSTRTNN